MSFHKKETEKSELVARPDRAVGVDHLTPFDEKAVLGTLKVKRNLLDRHVTTIHAAAAVACHFQSPTLRLRVGKPATENHL